MGPALERVGGLLRLSAREPNNQVGQRTPYSAFGPFQALSSTRLVSSPASNLKLL